MCSKFALIIGIEEYQNKNIRRVDYAEADAKEIQASLELHGFKDESVLLLSSSATKATIESNLRRICSFLTELDEFYLFFAGHGFSENGRNYITCFDTQIGDIIKTSISLQDIFRQIRDTACKHVILFLDSCHSGLDIDDKMRGIFTTMTESEISDFFKASEYQVGFASCKSDEYSYPSGVLRHGIWTYHVIKALNGESQSALDERNLLTADSLQSYLSKEVPRIVRETITSAKKQTPCIFGRYAHNFVVADLDPIITARRSKKRLEIQPDRIVLNSEEVGNIKSLRGYRRSHHIPDEINEVTQAFVKRIASENINEASEYYYQKIKKAFSYSRKDIKKSVDLSDGLATINCKDFEVSIDIYQSPDDSSEYILSIDVWRFESPEILFNESFNQVFSDTFNKIIFQTKSKINVAEFIDAVEDSTIGSIELKYPSDCSVCSLRIEGLKECIEIRPNQISSISDKNLEPRELLNRFIAANRLLIDYGRILKLPSPE